MTPIEFCIFQKLGFGIESGDWNWFKSKLGFRFLDSNFGRKFLAVDFLMFWLGFSLLKHDFGLQKIIFVQILIKMTPVEF